MTNERQENADGTLTEHESAVAGTQVVTRIITSFYLHMCTIIAWIPEVFANYKALHHITT